jgi:hypothetical protein
MHPLVARIHPSLRTAFFAWIIARIAVWYGAYVRLGSVLGGIDVGLGTPTYRSALEALLLVGSPWDVRILAGLSELVLLLGVVAVYRFARRDGVPQTADRATWLWIASPAMVFAVPGSDWAFAYGLVALAMASVTRVRWSALALCLAVALRPEAVVVWPALAWAWWSHRGETDPLIATVFSVLPGAAFAGTVLGGLLMGQPDALFAGAAGWREDFAWHGFAAHTTDLVVAGGVLVGLAIAIRMFKETPRSWIFCTLPVLVLVVMARPTLAGLAVIPFAIPLFVQTAKLAQDVGFERVLLTSSLVALCLVALV